MAQKAIYVPFYATVFRADGLEEALQEIAPLSLRYGASAYTVFRGGDDRYRYHTIFQFDDKADWERYWYGPEFVEWRQRYSSWFQVPVVYDAGSLVAEGRSGVADGVEAA